MSRTPGPSYRSIAEQAYRDIDKLREALRMIQQQPVGHTVKDAVQDLAAVCRIARAALSSHPKG